jgi:hypothetical protein
VCSTPFGWKSTGFSFEKLSNVLDCSQVYRATKDVLVLAPTGKAVDGDRTDRAQAWRRHTAQNLARETALERITATRQQSPERQRTRDQGYGLEL